MDIVFVKKFDFEVFFFLAVIDEMLRILNSSIFPSIFLRVSTKAKLFPGIPELKRVMREGGGIILNINVS